MNKVYKVETITDLSLMLKIGKPRHPLVNFIDFSEPEVEMIKEKCRVVSNFYTVYLKGDLCKNLKYGRQVYDFEEGTVVCIAPHQVYEAVPTVHKEKANKGWGLFFHPDLILGTTLADKIAKYSFFNYSSKEALHISYKEKEIIRDIVEKIDIELNQNIDKHTQQLIVSNIELLLNYLLRFYDRQFITRIKPNKDILVRLENYLDHYLKSGEIQVEGMPTVKSCAAHLNLSPNYLSDLLRKETGKSTQEHIHLKLIDHAKNLLLSTTKSVSEIAYSLGCGSPQYFSKLFKNKTGVSPLKYRRNI